MDTLNILSRWELALGAAMGLSLLAYGVRRSAGRSGRAGVQKVMRTRLNAAFPDSSYDIRANVALRQLDPFRQEARPANGFGVRVDFALIDRSTGSLRAVIQLEHGAEPANVEAAQRLCEQFRVRHLRYTSPPSVARLREDALLASR